MTEKEANELTRMHEQVREVIRQAPQTQKLKRMRALAQTRFREAYSEASLGIEPNPKMSEDQKP